MCMPAYGMFDAIHMQHHHTPRLCPSSCRHPFSCHRPAFCHRPACRTDERMEIFQSGARLCPFCRHRLGPVGSKAGGKRHSKAQQETARHSRSDAGLAIWALLFVALQDAYDLRELLQTSLDAGGLAIPFRLEPVVAEPLAVEGLAALERGHTCLKGY